MIKTTSKRITDALTEIEAMKKTGEAIRPLPFGKNNDTLFTSADQNLITAFDCIEVNGVFYYIGFKANK